MVSFIANRSVLPRESGISDKPLAKAAILFESPKELEVSIPIPHSDQAIKGMDCIRGITLIVGGGYHGKSTLLQAIEHGVYNHIEADGREYVLTVEQAVKIRAEDGRSISNVDIFPFIDKVDLLKVDYDVSTIIVMGGSGDYFDVADVVIKMEEYLPYHVTNEAKRIAERMTVNRINEGGDTFGQIHERIPLPNSLNSRKGNKYKVTVRGKSLIQYGDNRYTIG